MGSYLCIVEIIGMLKRTSAPYDVLIDPSGIWYGPAFTIPKSRDWLRFLGPVRDFFMIIDQPSFELTVVHWRVRGE